MSALGRFRICGVVAAGLRVVPCHLGAGPVRLHSLANLVAARFASPTPTGRSALRDLRYGGSTRRELTLAWCSVGGPFNLCP